MKLHTLGLFTMLTLGAASLSGCGGGGGGTPPTPPTPPKKTITVTGINVDLNTAVTGCAPNSTLTAPTGYTDYINIGAKGDVQNSDGSISEAGEDNDTYSGFYPTYTPTQLASELKDHYDQGPASDGATQFVSLNFDVIAAAPAGIPNFEGNTKAVCKNSQGGEVPLKFIIKDSSGTTLSNTTNISDLSANYTGPITFVAELADKTNNGIYVYDPKHPQSHAKSDTLNTSNKL